MDIFIISFDSLFILFVCCAILERFSWRNSLKGSYSNDILMPRPRHEGEVTLHLSSDL